MTDEERDYEWNNIYDPLVKEFLKVHELHTNEHFSIEGKECWFNDEYKMIVEGTMDFATGYRLLNNEVGMKKINPVWTR